VQGNVIAQAVSHRFLVTEAKVQSQVILVDREALEPVLAKYRGADKSLARPGRKQATATEDFDFRISY
jgi:hypothetical protein